MLSWPPKSPKAVLDYEVDWTAVLAEDTLATDPVATASGGLVIDSISTTDKKTVLWISGGDPVASRNVTPHVCLTGTTVGGRTLVIRINLPVSESC